MPYLAINTHNNLIAVVTADRLDYVTLADETYCANEIAGVAIVENIVTLRDPDGHEFCEIVCQDYADASAYALTHLGWVCDFDA